MNMDAVLRIVAKVDGGGAVAALGKTLNGVENSSRRLGGAFRNLSGALGGIGGAIAGAGLGVLAKNAIDTADNLNDLRQQTGVSVETLSRFGRAAQDSGSNLDSVARGMGKLSKGMYAVATGAKGAPEAFAALGISVTDASGKLRSVDAVMLEVAGKFATMPDGAEKTALAMQLFGKSGAELIPMLNEGSASLEKYKATISGDMAAAADKFNESLTQLGASLAGPFNQAITALLPTITAMAQGLVALVQAFSQLPGPIQTILVVLGSLLAALVVLAPAISAIVTIAGALAGIGLGATIAGWLGALGPLLTGLASFAAAIVGWPVLIVAALVAVGIAIYAFRDKIGAALQAIAGFFVDRFKAIGQQWMDLFQRLQAPLGQLRDAVGNAWKAIGETIKNAFRGVLQFVVNNINTAARLINVLISAYNRLPTPDLPLIPALSVPAFAQGGVVDRPTLAMVGEGGEREYIIPESKMGAASAAYLGGARGAGVVNPTINVTTGPVMQQGGQTWVTMTDLEKAMRMTADGVIGRLRTPSARMALGMR